MDKAELLALCERGVEAALAAGADAAEVYAGSDEDREVLFEKNDLNLVRAVSETSYGVRVFRDGRMGFATSNRPEALAEVAAEAVALARASPEDPLGGLPDPQPLPEVEDAVDPALLRWSLGELAELGVELLRETLARDGRMTVDSGSLGVSEAVRAVASSAGVRAAFRAAEASGYLFGMARDGAEVGSFSYDGDRVRGAEELLPALRAAYARFVDKCVGALGPRPGESFRGPIIVPPDAMEGFLMGDLLAALGADRVRKGSSPLGDRLGQSIASELLSLTEAGPGLPGFPLAPFDREGMPRRQTPLIRAGRLEDFLYDGYEARAAGRQSNGKALGGPGSPPRIGAAALTVAPGDSSMEALAAVERGIWVTRFSGSSDPVSGDFSGVVKGGFLIRDGERIPVAETTLSGNLYDCLKNISAISDRAERHGGVHAWPALRIEDVSVSAG